MTCEELRAMKGQGTDGLTPSLILAAMRHLNSCPACVRLFYEVHRRASPEQQARDYAAALAVMPSVIRHNSLTPRRE